MENLSLNEIELKHFAEWFSMCDVENSGKITGPVASDLFIKSGLSHDILLEIINICGAKRLGHFGRSQFYIALKLIAAVQHGFPLQLESIGAGRDIPLPRFIRAHQDSGRKLSATQSQPAKISQPAYSSSNRIPPAYDQPQNSTITVSTPNNSTCMQSDHQSPPISPQAQSVPPLNTTNAMNALNATHPQVSSNVKQTGVGNSTFSACPNLEKSSRTPHKIFEKGWASFEDDNQGLISEDKKEWTHFTDSSRADTSSLSSETESVEDIWAISEELRTYYLNQFLTMQPDIKGVISGSVAKDFFEKSKLPTPQLSKIWQLSDVNKDGALSLEEFNTAMHLVVCRINGMDLPDQLPPSLQLYVPFTNPDEPFACDLAPGSTLKRLTPASPGKAQHWQPTFSQPSPSSSSVSSPGQKPTPVNFEFRPITEDQDSTIAHPVALRMSPDGQAFPLDSNGKPLIPATTHTDSSTVGGDTAQVDESLDAATNPYATAHLHSRPRPTPKKAQSIAGTGQENTVLSPAFPPPPISSQEVAVDVPVPPPRGTTHSRSSSLDANQVLQSPDAVDEAISPPVVPPRPKEGCSSNEMSSSTVSATVTSPSDEKAVTPQHSGDSLHATSKVLTKLDSQQTKDLRQRIKEQTEKNLTLSRLNIELNSELQEVMEQRIALEIQMEHLRPYSAGYI